VNCSLFIFLLHFSYDRYPDINAVLSYFSHYKALCVIPFALFHFFFHCRRDIRDNYARMTKVQIKKSNGIHIIYTIFRNHSDLQLVLMSRIPRGCTRVIPFSRNICCLSPSLSLASRVELIWTPTSGYFLMYGFHTLSRRIDSIARQESLPPRLIQ